MNLKITIPFVILLISAISSNCDIIDKIYVKVGNTTGAIKDDIKSWWSYGKSMVFGNRNKVGDPEIDVRKSEEHSGIIGRTLSTLESGISAVWKGVHDAAVGGDQKKCSKVSLYDRVKNRLTRIQSQTGDIMKSYNSIYQNFTATNATKPVSEAINQYLFGIKSWNIDTNIHDNENQIDEEDIQIDVRKFIDKGLAIKKDINDGIAKAKGNIDNTLTYAKDRIEDAKQNSENRIKENESRLEGRIKDKAVEMTKLSYGDLF